MTADFTPAQTDRTGPSGQTLRDLIEINAYEKDCREQGDFVLRK